MGGIYGTRESVRAARIAIKKAFRGIATVHFFDEKLLKLAQKAASVLRWLGIGKTIQRQVASVLPVFDLLKGIPSRQHLYGAGWRGKGEPVNGSLNPLDNKWGLMWLSPIVPMVGRSALELESIIAPIYEKYGFEPLTTMTSITPRALCCVMTIAYDKSIPAECKRASACYDALFEACMQRGFVPYRCGLNSMQKLDRHSQGYWAVVQQLKTALDPKNIIAPGRYLPGSAREGEPEQAAEPPALPKAQFEYAAK
jgi:4-cresol dehydrogenase (hydroxylating)